MTVGTLHFLIFSTVLAVSVYGALPTTRRLHEVPSPAPGPDSASPEGIPGDTWNHHGPGEDHHGPDGGDSWYLPEEVHLLEKKVDGFLAGDRNLTGEVAELKDEVKAENKTLTELFQEFEEFKSMKTRKKAK